MEKILVVACMPLYQEKGSSLRAREAIKMLSQKYKVDVVCYRLGKDAPLEGVSLFRTPKFFQPKLKPFQITFSRFVLDIFVFFRVVLLLLSRRYSVLHAEDFEAAFIAGICKIFCPRKKLVYNLHNRISENMHVSIGKKNRFLAFLLRNAEKMIIKKSNLILCNWKRYTEDDSFAFGKKILWYDSVSLEIKEPSLSSILPKQYILYSGNTLPYQGVLEFLSETKDAGFSLPLIIVGKANDVFRKAISFLEKQRTVFFLGELSVAETNFLIKKALFCVVPRLSPYSSSMKVLHYLANGKPIFAKNIPYNDECIVHGQNGILYNSSSELLSFYEKVVTNNKFLKTITDGAEISGKKIRENWLQSNFLSIYDEHINKTF